MLDNVSLNLVNMVASFGKRDLEKVVEFDNDASRLVLSRNGNDRSVYDFFKMGEGKATHLGMENAVIRGKLANALMNIVAGNDGVVGKAQQKALNEIFATLFGSPDSAGGAAAKERRYLPITAREVKQLVTKAQQARAQSALESLRGGSGIAKLKSAETLISRLCASASLHGKTADVDKMVGKLEVSLAKLGAKFEAAATDRARAKVSASIAATVDKFISEARKLDAKMPGMDLAIDMVLDDYMENTDAILGPGFQNKFRTFARGMVTEGMSYNAFVEQLEDVLPGMVKEAQASASSPLLHGKKTGDIPKPAEIGLSQVKMEGVRNVYSQARTAAEAGVQNGENLKSVPKFSVGADKFDTSVFLKGQPRPSDNSDTIEARFDAQMKARGRGGFSFNVVDSRNSTVSLKQYRHADVDMICGGVRGVQSTAVKAAMMLDISRLVQGVADELNLDEALKGDVKKGCSCTLNLRADGSVDVTLATMPGSYLESSLTLNIDRDGARKFVSFSGVKTNEKYAEKVEQDARRAALKVMLDPENGSIGKTNADKRTEILAYLGSNKFVTGLKSKDANEFKASVTNIFDGLIKNLNDLAANPEARLEKTPAQYESEYLAQVENLQKRVKDRVESNDLVIADFDKAKARLDAQSKVVIGKASAAGRTDIKAYVENFVKWTSDTVSKMQANFWLSGEETKAAAEELTKAVNDFADSAVRIMKMLDGKEPTAENFVAFQSKLSALRFPVLTFKAFSESARAAMMSKSGLLSTETVEQAAVRHAGNGAVSAAVADFSDAVNGLRSLASVWDSQKPDIAKNAADFEKLAEKAHDDVVKMFTEGIESGADLSKGIGKVLGDKLAPLYDAFAKYECEDMKAKFADQTGECVRLLEGFKTDGIKGKDKAHPVPLSAAQIKDVDDAIAKIGALNAQFETVLGTNRPIKREAFMALQLNLKAAFGDFTVKLANPGASRKQATNWFFKAYNAIGSKFDDEASYSIKLPEVPAEYDTSVTSAANPFLKQGGAGFASIEELERTIRAESAIGKKFSTENPELQNMARDLFYENDAARPFLEIDEENRVLGFKKINGNEVGRDIVAAALKTAVAKLKAEYVKELENLPAGVQLNAEKYTGAAGMEALKDAIRTAFAGEIDRYAAVAKEEEKPAPEILPGEVLKRGNDVLGLDVAYLRKEGKLEAFKTILLGMMTTSVISDYQKLKDENPEAADQLMEKWLHQSEPLNENNQTLLMLSGHSVDALKTSLLTGDIPLDGSINLPTAMLVQNLSKLGSERASTAARDGDAGFANHNPGENYALLVRNGLKPDVIARICTPGEKKTLDSVVESFSYNLSFLFAANRCDASGIDALCRRLTGKHIFEFDAKDMKKLSRMRSELRSIKFGIDEDGNAAHPPMYMIDPLSHADEALKSGVMFFTRSAIPSVDNAADTMVVYRALSEMSREGGPTERQVTYNGTDFTLRVEDGVLTATAHANNHKFLELVQKNDSDDKTKLKPVRKDLDIPVVCPLDTKGFMVQLEEEIAANASVYGRDVALALFNADGFDAGSSRARQLALNVIAGLTGTLAAEVCHVPTKDLVEIARAMLQPKADPKAVLQAKLSALGAGVTRFNGEATLDLYRKMQDTDKDELNQKVKLPAEKKIRDGETFAEARLRRVHEFIAELVMPDDTTRYDIDRANGKSDAEIMRRTLLDHKYELSIVLRDLGTDKDLLDTFSLATGDAVDGVVPRIHDITTALKSRMFVLKDMVENAGGIDAFFAKMNAEGGQDAPGLNKFLQDFAADLAAASDRVLAKMQGVLTDKLASAFRESTASAKGKELWQKTLDEIAGSGTLDVDTGYGRLLMEALSTYFSKMEPIDRHRMSSSLLRYAGSASNSGEILGALIKGAGPVLQKLMQGLPQTALPQDLRQAVTDLKSNLPSIPAEMVRATLLDMIERSNGRIKSIELTKSLGAATVGQAFLCRIVTDNNPAGEECVIKILRPDVQARARRERDLFLDIAKRTKGMAGVFDVRLEGIFRELDFTVEANNVKQGVVYTSGVVNDGIDGVRSMELYPFIGATANTLVVRKAPGVTFDRYIADSAKRIETLLGGMKKVRAEDGSVTYQSGSLNTIANTRSGLVNTYNDILARQKQLTGFIAKWTYEAIFDGGFFHGDVHAGNLMCDGTSLTVIDYGNASRFTKKESDSLKWALAWIPAKDATKFVDNYANLLSPEGRKGLAARKNELVKALQSVFDRADASDTGRIMSATFQLIQEMGVELPGPIFSLLQSMQRLDETVRLMNEQLSTIETALGSMDLSDHLQEGEAPLPDFLAPFLDFADPTKKDQIVAKNMTFGQLFAEFKRHIAAGSCEEGGMTNCGQAVMEYVQSRIINTRVKGEEPPANRPETYQDKLNKLIADATSDDKKTSEKARNDLAAQFDQIRAFVKIRGEMGTPNDGIASTTILSMLDNQPKEPIADHRKEWDDFVKSMFTKGFARMVTDVVVSIKQTIELPTDMRDEPLPLLKPFDDASAGFGNALERGSREFAASFKGFSGGIAAIRGGAIGLRNALKEITIEATRQRHREDYVENSYGRYAADHGIYAAESLLIDEAMQDFRFEAHLMQTLKTSGWFSKAENLRSVARTLKFNIENIRKVLSDAGFIERVNDKDKRKAFIELAMSKLIGPHPEWYRAFTGVNPDTIDRIADGDDDVKTALQFLKNVASAPPNDRLTDEEVRKIDDQFRLA